MVQEQKYQRNKRDLGLDLIRFLSFVPIVFHHFNALMWYETVPVVAQSFLPWEIFYSYSRLLSFSGQTILFLSSFLIARAEVSSSKTFKVILWVLMGWIIFCLFELSPFHSFFIWDIYPLIALGLLSCLLFKKFLYNKRNSLLLFSGAGFLLTWIKFWEWPFFQSMNLFPRSWLIGDCLTDFADWPILPWVGLIWMGYGIGAYALEYNQRNPEKLWLYRFLPQEKYLWPILLLLCLPQLGAFYRIQIGPLFACYAFRQEPLIFWSHFLFIIFLVRVSLLGGVQAYFERFRLLHWISQLKVSTHFGMVYLVHYVVLETYKCFHFKNNGTDALLSFLVFLTVIPVTEVLVRTIIIVFRRATKERPTV